MVRELTVLYDAACPLCVRCRDWMGEQPAFVTLRFLASESDEARARYGAIPWLGAELVVASDEGDALAGPAAFIVCLWALRDWRECSKTISGSSFASPVAERFFRALSSRRHAIAALLIPDRCEGGTCPLPHPPRVAYR